MKKILRFIVAFLVSLTILANFVSPALAYSYAGVRWDTTTVCYNSAYTVPSEWQTPIANAAATWSSPTAFYLYRNDYSTTNFIYVYDYGHEAYPAWTMTDVGGDSYIDYCMTIINSHYITEHDLDLETVALHEFGHWLKLYDLMATGPVMHGDYEEQKRSLTEDDIAGIEFIY